MKRNPSLPLPESWREPPQPGFLYCCMDNVLGWGQGCWRVQVIIDYWKQEYNTRVSINGSYRRQIPETKVKELENEGLELTQKELNTILKLYKSWRFQYFISHYFTEQWEDVGRTHLEMFTVADKICLHSERFDFFQKDHLPNNQFRLGAWYWTRGLKNIYKRIFSEEKQ